MNEQLTQLYGYLHGMWRYRWSALLVAWFVGIVGAMVVISLPSQYTSGAVVYIDTTSIMKPLLKGLTPETDTLNELTVMSRVLLSRDNLLTVIRETDMDLEVETPQDKDDLVEKLGRTIVIKGGGSGRRWEPKSNIYEISYQSNSAERSYQVVSSLLKTMIEDTLNSTRTDTVAAQKFLDLQIASYEERLTIAEQQLAEFKKSNVGFMPDERGSYYIRLQRAQDDLDTSKADLRLAKRRLAELKKQISGEQPMLDSESYQSSNAVKLRQSQEQLANLLDLYTEQHPDVQSLKAIIVDLQDKLESGESGESGDAGGDSIATGPEAEFNPVYQQMKVELSKASIEVETLKIQLSEQTKVVEKLKSSIDVIPEVEARLAKLNRGYKVIQERYLDLLMRSEGAKLAQSAGQSASDVTFRIIESPVVSTKASGPRRLMFLLVVFAAALGAGLGWSFLRYMLQPTFIDLGQMSEITGLPVLGTVSLHLLPEHRKRRRYQLFSFLMGVVLLAFICGMSVIFMRESTQLMANLG